MSIQAKCKYHHILIRGGELTNSLGPPNLASAIEILKTYTVMIMNELIFLTMYRKHTGSLPSHLSFRKTTSHQIPAHQPVWLEQEGMKIDWTYQPIWSSRDKFKSFSESRFDC
jgi:hypothetical protein